MFIQDKNGGNYHMSFVLVIRLEARSVYNRDYILFILMSVIPTTRRLLYQHRIHGKIVEFNLEASHRSIDG